MDAALRVLPLFKEKLWVKDPKSAIIIDLMLQYLQTHKVVFETSNSTSLECGFSLAQ